jgi:pimeloyl-ACP methyl ester carboxylesterase
MGNPSRVDCDDASEAGHSQVDRAESPMLRHPFDECSRDLQEQHNAFRSNHKPIDAEILGHWWTYLLGGSGPQTVLVLPGVPGRADTAFAYIQALERDYRVICPNYPSSVRSLAGLIEGLIALLARENVTCVHVIGGSYGAMIAGAMIAQHLARGAPALINALILEHPSVPHPGRARFAPLATGLASLLPIQLVRLLVLAVSRQFLHEMATDRRTYWRAYFRCLINGFTRQDYLARLTVLFDYDRSVCLRLSDLADWTGHVLLVEAEADRLIRTQERSIFCVLYPEAEHVAIPGTTHTSSLETPERYLAVCRPCLQQFTAPGWQQ